MGTSVASTSTNLAALLPFLFIGGLSGLLFQKRKNVLTEKENCDDDM